MKSTTELLDIAKAKQGGISDYRLAQLLAIPPSGIANWRAGRNLPANEVAMRLAEFAGLDPEAAVCWVNIERGGPESSVKAWRRILSRVQRSKPVHLAS